MPSNEWGEPCSEIAVVGALIGAKSSNYAAPLAAPSAEPGIGASADSVSTEQGTS